ncbi:hypothetical protein P5P86_00160 [Nocardioides sp. BP30]|uniref:hypothetical protein n=1 Tax=Nocardioides sp. BP30 TaxID=3036374 RepID=UPI002468AEA8|nr:hypothetical protein [Nocardioides sp. BP30]WGL52261.1 hypothetical protein P5P86_00160 [Nocardioides sp. BP30]
MSLFDSVEFRTALARVQATHDEAIGSLRAARGELARELERFDRAKARRDEERAAAARRGDLGPERQRLQRRLDAGETTWADVRSGRDTHPSAAAVRTYAERNLADLAARMRTDPRFQAAQADLSALLGARPGGPDRPGDDGA